jgi:hypothetical protein
VPAAARVIRTTRRHRLGHEIAPIAGDECLAAAASDRCGPFSLAAPDHAAHRAVGSDWRGPTDAREGDADERASRTRLRWAHRTDPTLSAVTRASTKTSPERGRAAAPRHSSRSRGITPTPNRLLAVVRITSGAAVTVSTHRGGLVFPRRERRVRPMGPARPSAPRSGDTHSDCECGRRRRSN